MHSVDERNHAMDAELLHTYRSTREAGHLRSAAGLREANLARSLGVTVEDLRGLNDVAYRRAHGIRE